MNALREETAPNVVTLVRICDRWFAIRWIDGQCHYRQVGK
jgi:hypothetical protein